VVVGPEEPDKSDGLTADDRAAAEAKGRLRFLGSRSDVEELYTAFDLYVLASWREGYPRSAMEAAAMGLPIVATDIRGCRQVVADGETGVLVPPRDPVALTAAIRGLVDDPARRRAMGRAARARAVRHFDQQRQIDLSLEVYERLLARAGRTPPTPEPAPSARPATPRPATVAPSGAVGDGPVVRLARPDDVGALAALHAERIVPSFLASLGPGFLRRLYRRVVRDPGSFAVVAERSGTVVGFVAVALDTRRFYRAFAVHDGMVAGLAAAPRLVRRLPSVLETWRYGRAADGDAPAPTPAAASPTAGSPAAEAEILSVAVAASEAGRGVGSRLTRAAVDHLRRLGVERVRVVTADDNEAGRRLYERAGFVTHARVEVHAGVPQRVLVWTADGAPALDPDAPAPAGSPA
jgi:ribosomal protein S18 acetylase RimI-like enzyme